MISKLSPSEVKSRVDAVNKQIEDARLKRVAQGIVETPAETAARIASETAALNVAKGTVSKSEEIHLKARDSRVRGVMSAIEAARKERLVKESKGIMETPGAKSDRLVKESEDLAAANVVNAVEPFTIDSNNIAIQTLADKLNEVISYLNEPYTAVLPPPVPPVVKPINN